MKSIRSVINISLTLIFIFFSVCHTIAQKEPKERLYESWIRVYNIQSVVYSGYLLESKDSSLVIGGNIYKKRTPENIYENLEIPYQDISQMYVRNKDSKRTGAGIGALAGVALSLVNVIGIYSGDGLPFPNYMVIPTIILESAVFISVGAGIGAGIGSIKKKVPFYREPERYQENKDLLINYVKNASGDNKNRKK